MISEIFTIQQAARYLQLDSGLVLDKIRAGEIPAARKTASASSRKF
jgi:excisionase family DNA binding protein